MLNQGVGSWTARRARRTPERVAIIHGEIPLSYAALHDRVLRLARALRDLGVSRGDRVAYLGSNHPALLETMFAAGALGSIFIPLNTRLAAPEVAHHLADSGSRVLVYAPGQAGLVDGLRPGLAACELIALAAPAAGEHGYEQLLATASAEELDEPVGLDDPFLILYTSGTTGSSKGATLTHGNVTWNAINVITDADFRPDEVALVVAPLFHAAALNMLSTPTLLKGGTLVIEGAFDPARALDLIAAHRVTSMFGVPAMYDALAAHELWATSDLSSLRQLMCGGAPVPDATIRTWLTRGLTFIQGYGMTEATPGALLLDAAHAKSKAGSAGVPHFFTDVCVVRPDLTAASPGETGEIVVAGPNVMAGYWNQPEATARTLADGRWLRSGDAGVTDPDGYTFVVDRMKDMIISGGENIFPAEVENVLLDHPAVAECGMIGVPDSRWGEVGRVVVVLHPGTEASEEEILAFLDGRLARYKIPKSARFTDSLPRTASGKILKKKLRESYG
jgi:fatty-acyl-CoA synthase